MSRPRHAVPMKKASLYFPEDMIDEIKDEAYRQDRSISWLVTQAWKIARGEIQATPDPGEHL